MEELELDSLHMDLLILHIYFEGVTTYVPVIAIRSI